MARAGREQSREAARDALRKAEADLTGSFGVVGRTLTSPPLIAFAIGVLIAGPKLRARFIREAAKFIAGRAGAELFRAR